MTKDISLFGSFQDGLQVRVENPRQEAWDHLARFRAFDFLKEISKPSSPRSDWDDYLKYAAIRFRQAHEFHIAASGGTIITAPLPLYYSFLNLTRAGMAIREEIKALRGHGLGFTEASDLLDCEARSVDGTVTQFIRLRTPSCPPTFSCTLRDCFASIVEMINDYTRATRVSRVTPLQVEAFRSGNVELRFDQRCIPESEFRSSWRMLYPGLADLCDLGPEGSTLLLKERKMDYKAVSAFCSQHLLTDLVPRQSGLWYVLRHDSRLPELPREAWYLIAMFILSNIVRYEPESLAEGAHPDSELGWLLERFLRTSDRFFPQLMYSWIIGENIFYTVA